MEIRVKSLPELADYIDKIAKECRDRAKDAKTHKEKDRLLSVAAAYEGSALLVRDTKIVTDDE